MGVGYGNDRERERENQRVKFSKSVVFQELSTTVSEVKEIHS